MKKNLFKVLATLVVALFATFSLSACSSQGPIDMSSVSAVVDVRTPAETAEGYLEGALLIDWQGPDFGTEIEKLDKAANYVIYCRSGNRAGQAIEAMKGLGFTGTLTNAGGLDDAASVTGLPIVF
ncbi:rhodanese-like domain-containing protein [Rhodoluna limnophila]|uniref:rhodanese-like domain-containing protein n=1 Tax=Rhodoluna limnophila TaxID=232537 RepID=UPI0011069703|nr:rhodanese-like domain-containing protein [Rhodoluna limnophila]